MDEVVELLSCDPLRLYGDHPIVDHQLPLERLVETSARHRGQIEVIAEVFPPATVDRPAPATLVGPDEGFLTQLRQYLTEENERASRISPSLLVRIKSAIIWNNMLFALVDGQVLPIYEFYRPTDRGPIGPRILSRLAACANRASLDCGTGIHFFLGSAGSFNYGHWLVDDLPGLAGFRDVPRSDAGCTILMTGFDYDSSNRIRADGIGLALGGDRKYSIRYLDQRTAYTVSDVYYVTPVSYHSSRKHPLALDHVRRLGATAVAKRPSIARPEKIFVNRRPPYTRCLLNSDAVLEVLRQRGFEAYVPNDHDLLDQWATFGAASHVAGIMGAGMTGTVFSPVGTQVTHLAPTGWFEPFYWDIAAMGGHSYSAVYGPDDGTTVPLYRRWFSVDPDMLAAALTAPNPA